MADTTEDLRTATLSWAGSGADFEATTDAGSFRVQGGGPSREWSSPIELLLVAAAGCMAIDVIDILTRGRKAPATYEISISGVRHPEPPHRYTELRLRHTLRGTEEAAVRRAVTLSQDKYCSVMATLDPAMPVQHEIRIIP